MKNADEIKAVVREKYGEIAKKSLAQLENTSCCGTQCCDSPHDMTCFNDDYTKLDGYNQSADLKLGCGIPTEVAAIKAGDTVLDLGAGAGNDAFVARAIVGAKGKVLGLDMTEAMIEKASANARALGFTNVEFRLGDIEEMPIEQDSIDVVISNCVLNLVPNKQKAFNEMYRVLKAGGHFSISDIVLTRPLPPELQKEAELYAGCVSGAIEKLEYLNLLRDSGFKNILVKIEKPIVLPREVLSKYLAPEEANRFNSGNPAIVSITVYGEK